MNGVQLAQAEETLEQSSQLCIAATTTAWMLLYTDVPSTVAPPPTLKT
jgi:hypothetical protein